MVKPTLLKKSCRLSFRIALAVLVLYVCFAFLWVTTAVTNDFETTLAERQRVASSRRPVTPDDPLTFDDIVIESLLGTGSISTVFKVRIPRLGGADGNNNNNGNDKQFILKIAEDDDLKYSSVETQIFDLLNKPPTHPSIPPLVFHVPSMSE